jgi:acetyl esterase/lipase
VRDSRHRSPLPGLLSRIALADVRPVAGVYERLASFGPQAHQYALCFLPTRAVGRSWVYFLHGGSWSSGSPRQYAFVGRFLAANGFPAVVAGYRLAPDYRWPAQLDDAWAGVRAALGAIPRLVHQSLVLAGFSAGGQIAALMALSPEAEQRIGVPVAGFLGISAPLDFSAYEADSPSIEALTGHAGPWPEADPIVHVSGLLPPTLLVQGQLDTTVSPPSARRFAAAADRVAPDRLRLIEVPWMQHADAMRLFLEESSESHALLDWLAERGSPELPGG